jgi:Kdo2-lipid A phosphotransferase
VARSQGHGGLNMPTTQFHWRWLGLVCGLSVAACLLASWFTLPLRPAWDVFDRQVFFLLNATLESGDSWRWFWAAANTRIVDAVSALLFGVIFAVYICRPGWRGLAERVAEGCFLAGYTIFVLDISSNWIFTFERLSPSLTLEPVFHLADVITSVKVKDVSSNSFPGDHGTAVMMFATLIWFYAGTRYGLWASLLAGLLVWPRLVSGAHWITDLFVGSASIAIIALSIALATPLARVAPLLLVRLVWVLATPLIERGWVSAAVFEQRR